MAWRTAGRLGDGGGPGRRVVIFSPPRPTMFGEAQVLQVGANYLTRPDNAGAKAGNLNNALG